MNPSWIDSHDQIQEILIRSTPLIDVRAPIEFEKGAIPGAVNLPVLNNDERAAVGTAFKREGQAQAIRLGHSLVSGDVLKARLQAWATFAAAHPNSAIYCFRGGLRSQSVQTALKDAGFRLPLIRGGYKRLRSYLITSLEQISSSCDFLIISGLTGVGKTDFLKSLSRSMRVCDLEDHANHRGSAFGKMFTRQPTQANFENQVAVTLIRELADARKSGPVLLEDESRTIGGLTIPQALFSAMERSKVVVIERTLEDRSKYLVELYIRRYGLEEGDSDKGRVEVFRQDLHQNLHSISKKLGGLEYKHLLSMMDSAIDEQIRTGRHDVHREWVQRLLVRYYDPFYYQHLERIHDRIIARGTLDEIGGQLKLALAPTA